MKKAFMILFAMLLPYFAEFLRLGEFQFGEALKDAALISGVLGIGTYIFCLLTSSLMETERGDSKTCDVCKTKLH